MWKWLNTVIATNTFSEHAAHILGGYAAVLTVLFLPLNWVSKWWYPGFVVAAALKEYVYDANFETPHQTFVMNTADFLGYCVGIGLGIAVTIYGS
jgi:hypothetical protein